MKIPFLGTFFASWTSLSLASSSATWGSRACVAPGAREMLSVFFFFFSYDCSTLLESPFHIQVLKRACSRTNEVIRRLEILVFLLLYTFQQTTQETKTTKAKRKFQWCAKKSDTGANISGAVLRISSIYLSFAKTKRSYMFTFNVWCSGDDWQVGLVKPNASRKRRNEIWVWR